MSRGDAFIIVTCDGCRCEERVSLRATARGGYDERDVESELEDMGWMAIGGRDYCGSCAEDVVDAKDPETEEDDVNDDVDLDDDDDDVEEWLDDDLY